MIPVARSLTSIPTRVYKLYKILLKHFGPQYWWPAETPLEVAIGAILTQNTAWANVEKAIGNLKKENLIDADRILKNRKRIPGLIRPTGYYNIKSRRLLHFIEYIKERYRGNLTLMKKAAAPKLRSELLSIKGIGPETADSILLYALDKKVFVVDAYTRRIFTRHDFFNRHATYDEIQRFFMHHIKPNLKVYNEFHALIVRLGKTSCYKNKPDCESCPVESVI